MRRLSSVAGAALLAGGLVACGVPPGSTGTPADEQVIRDLVHAYVEAWNRGDAAGMAALVADDYEMIPDDGVHVRGRAAFQELLEADIAARPAGVTLSAPPGFMQWMGPGAATLGGTWTVKGLPEGTPDRGSWLSVVRRHDDRWWISTLLVATHVPMPGSAGG